MYSVKFYNFADELAYTLAAADIIEIDFSEIEIESEKSFFRTPQRATINCIATEWITDNIVKMPLSNVVDRSLCKYKALIYSDAALVATMIILNDQLNNSIDLGAATIVCYDYTKMLELYDELSFDNLGAAKIYWLKTSGDVDGSVKLFLDKIGTVSGLPLTSTQEAATAQQNVSSEQFLLINSNEDETLSTLTDADNKAINPDYLIDEFIYDEVGLLGEVIRVGWNPNIPSTSLNYQDFVVLHLAIFEAYLSTATYSVVKSKWDVRPKYMAKMRVEVWRPNNITAWSKVSREDFVTDWAYISPSHVSTARPTFSQAFPNIWGLDEEEKTTDSWISLIRQFKLYALNTTSGNFSKFGANPIFKKAIDLPVPYSGSYSVGLINYLNITLAELSELKIRRTGTILPHAVTLSQRTVNHLALIKEQLYISRQQLYASYDGTIRVVNIIPDAIGVQIPITDANIIYLSTTIMGIGAKSDYNVNQIAGDNTSYLSNKLSLNYKTYQNRREIELDAIDLGSTPELFNNYLIKNEFLTYLKSFKPNYESNVHTLKLGVLDIATIEFTVTYGGIYAIKDVSVTIIINNVIYSYGTDENGKCRFINVPISSIPYQYNISKDGYTLIEDTILVDEIDDYEVTKVIVDTKPTEPEIKLRSLITGMIEVELIQAEGQKIYYTTDGEDVTTEEENYQLYIDGIADAVIIDTTSVDDIISALMTLDLWGISGNNQGNLYTTPFLLNATKTVKARAYSVIGVYSTSTLSEEVEVGTVSVLTPKIRKVFIDDSQEVSVVIDKPEISGAIVRYTTDGSEPDEDSPIYSEPIFLTKKLEAEKIRAKTFFNSVESDEVAYQRSDEVIIQEGEVDFASSSDLFEQTFENGIHHFRVTIQTFVDHTQTSPARRVIIGMAHLFDVATFQLPNYGLFIGLLPMNQQHLSVLLLLQM